MTDFNVTPIDFTKAVPVGEKLTITIEHTLSDGLCADIMGTALEGGIGYWSQAAGIKHCKPAKPVSDHPNETVYESFDLYELDDGEPDGSAAGKVTYATIRKGIEAIVSGRVKVNREMRGQVLANVIDEEQAMDADAADCVVQAGLLGEIRYG